MTRDDLERLIALESRASAAPWHVLHLDDDMRMGAVAVSRSPEAPDGQNMRAGTWPGADIVAACLIQSPPYAVTSDDRFEENAELIAEVRNALPELLRLAKIALKA